MCNNFINNRDHQGNKKMVRKKGESRKLGFFVRLFLRGAPNYTVFENHCAHYLLVFREGDLTTLSIGSILTF